MSIANHMIGRRFWERICLSQILQSKEDLIRTNMHFIFSSYWACELNIVLLLSGLNNWTFYGSLHLYNKLSAPISVYNTPVPVRNGNNIDAFHGQSHSSLNKTQSNNAAVNKSNNRKVFSANGPPIKAKTNGSYSSNTALFMNKHKCVSFLHIWNKLAVCTKDEQNVWHSFIICVFLIIIKSN